MFVLASPPRPSLVERVRALLARRPRRGNKARRHSSPFSDRPKKPRT